MKHRQPQSAPLEIDCCEEESFIGVGGYTGLWQAGVAR